MYYFILSQEENGKTAPLEPNILNSGDTEAILYILGFHNFV